MKKLPIIILTILIIVAIFLTSDISTQNERITKEIKRLEKIIDLKTEINLEYSYLFEQSKKEDIDEQLTEKREKLKEQKEIIENLQEEIITLKDDNKTIEEKIEEIYRIQEQRKLEIERQSTVKIDREITYSQFPEYPTGCESIALYILLKYYDIDVTPEEIVDKLKKGQLPYDIEDKTYGGNPEIEFIGDPRNDYSYGVFNTPIAEVAATYKENVQNKQGLELEELLEIVSQNRPVMVWTTIGNISSKISETWTYRNTGETIYWKENEHAVVIIGYTNNTVIVSDPYTGEIEKYDRNRFKTNYNYLGKRAVYY